MPITAEQYYSPEFGAKEFGLAKERLGKEQEEGRKRLRHGFQRSRMRSSGAFLESLRKFDEQALQETGQLIGGLQLEQAARQREERMGREQRGWQTGERLGGQEFTAGQSALDRALQKWGIGQQREEAGVQRGWQTGQSALDRALQKWGIRKQTEAQRYATKQQKKGAWISGIGSLLGGLGSAI